MAKSPSPSALSVLLRTLDQAFDAKSWHGTNLRGSIRGMTATEAAWRPAPTRHNAWEIVVHAAYWKYTVRRRLRGEKPGGFAVSGSNWFPRPEAGAPPEPCWRADIALLVAEHRLLRAAIAELRPDDLAKPVDSGSVDILALVTGIAAHDLYHAGQIQLLKRLRAEG